MAVIGVTSRGRAVQHTHENNRLRVALEGAPARGSEIELEVEYRGIPATGLYIGANKFGERVFFGVSWPDLARQWLPTIDHPSDKATSEFIVTAPSHYQVVANGLLVEEVDLADGTRRTHWRQSVPISTWLNTIGVARFAVHHAGEAAGVPLQTWVFTADRENGQRDFEGPARAAMSFYADTFGPYSYEKLANLQASGMTGGNETASAILYGEKSITGEEKIRNLVAHEIAHQWFGNSVTESDWDDIWLSEGFATYSTLMFVEHTEGRDAFVAGLERARTVVLETQQKMPDTAILHRNLSDTTKILNRLVYQKGGWTLHMLRGVIGHEAFVAGLRDYYRTYRNGLATTDDFRRTMERASGKELGWFFSQWLTRSGMPDIKGTWRYDVKARQVVVELAQRQAGDELPAAARRGDDVEGPPGSPDREGGARWTGAAMDLRCRRASRHGQPRSGHVGADAGDLRSA